MGAVVDDEGRLVQWARIVTLVPRCRTCGDRASVLYLATDGDQLVAALRYEEFELEAIRRGTVRSAQDPPPEQVGLGDIETFAFINGRNPRSQPFMVVGASSVTYIPARSTFEKSMLQ